MPIIIDALDNPDAIRQTVDAFRAMKPQCAHCAKGHKPRDGHMGVMIHDYGMDEVFACTKSR